MTRWLGSRSTCSFILASGLGRNGESLPLWDKIIAPWGLFCAVHEAFRIAHFQIVQDYVSQFITTIVEANTKPGYTFLVELEVPEHRGSQWSNSGFIWPQNGLSKRQTPSCSVWSCSPSSITQLQLHLPPINTPLEVSSKKSWNVEVPASPKFPELVSYIQMWCRSQHH